MTVTFPPLTREAIPDALGRMRRLYALEALGFDEQRHRRAIDALLAEPGWGGVWLIAVDGEAAGYLVITLGFSLEFHGRYALLDELYLDDPWRGLGLGFAALEFAADWSRARGLRALRLEVGHANPRALGLYRRSGFELHDRHLMTRWL